MYATLWKIEHGHLAFGDDSYFARTFRFTFVSLGFGLLLPWASGWKLTRENVWSTAIRRIALWSYGLYLVHLPVSLIVTPNGFSRLGKVDLPGALFFHAPNWRSDRAERAALSLLRVALHPVARKGGSSCGGSLPPRLIV